jgi:hypothetical protein
MRTTSSIVEALPDKDKEICIDMYVLCIAAGLLTAGGSSLVECNNGWLNVRHPTRPYWVEREAIQHRTRWSKVEQLVDDVRRVRRVGGRSESTVSWPLASYPKLIGEIGRRRRV